MEPYETYTDQQKKQRRQLKLLAAIAVVLLCILVIFKVLLILSFHVVSTDPSLDNFPTAVTSVTFNFNEPLSSQGVVVSSAPDITLDHTVSGKSLTIALGSNLTVGSKYTITIGSISSTSGKQIHNKSFVFMAKDVAFDKLSKAQQQAILKQQATVPYSRTSIVFNGTDALIDNGITADQVAAMGQAFFAYSKTISKQFSAVSINDASLVVPPYDPDNPPAVSSVTFTVQIDKDSYSAKLAYSGLSAAELYLSNADGSQVYDSGMIDLSTQSGQ